jgi:hypothetical protein
MSGSRNRILRIREEKGTRLIIPSTFAYDQDGNLLTAANAQGAYTQPFQHVSSFPDSSSKRAVEKCLCFLL